MTDPAIKMSLEVVRREEARLVSALASVVLETGVVVPFQAFDERTLPPEPKGAGARRYLWIARCAALLVEHLDRIQRTSAEAQRALAPS